MIIHRAGELIAEVLSFSMRLTLAHEDLLVAAPSADAGKIDAWQETRIKGLRESLEAIKSAKQSTTNQLGVAFDGYVEAADALLRAADSKSAAAAAEAVKSRYSATQLAADRVLAAGRLGQRTREVLKWLATTATTVALAIFGAEYSAQKREAERAQEQAARDDEARDNKVMTDAGRCTEQDWSRRNNVERAGDVECRAWTVSAWRTADYELRADVSSETVKLLRLTTTWDVRDPPFELGVADGPAPVKSILVCGVFKGTPLRVAGWYRVPAGAGSVLATAFVRDKGTTPC